MNVIRKVLFVLASFIAGAGIMMAQNTFPLTGTVVDAQGFPVIGAGVVQTGTTNGTVTDDNGQFVIRVPENASVEVSALGYVPVTITAKNGETPEVVLQEDTKLLDEVVVNAQQRINLRSGGR